jgi:hypothetical protein
MTCMSDCLSLSSWLQTWQKGCVTNGEAFVYLSQNMVYNYPKYTAQCIHIYILMQYMYICFCRTCLVPHVPWSSIMAIRLIILHKWVTFNGSQRSKTWRKRWTRNIFRVEKMASRLKHLFLGSLRLAMARNIHKIPSKTGLEQNSW